MNGFKWRHFRGEIILGCVRWNCKYGRGFWHLLNQWGVSLNLISRLLSISRCSALRDAGMSFDYSTREISLDHFSQPLDFGQAIWMP